MLFNREGKLDIFMQNCPHYHSGDIKNYSKYKTKLNGEHTLYACQNCGASFSETYGSPISGLTTLLSEIAKVLKARMEGMGRLKYIREGIWFYK
jgi:transposase-like protein